MRLLRERPRARRRETTIVALFSATLFLSAGLVFLVQPMYAKFILPLFGSTPAIWNASMLFFQTTLLAGYLYAHESTRRLGVRRQDCPARRGAPARCAALTGPRAESPLRTDRGGRVQLGHRSGSSPHA